MDGQYLTSGIKLLLNLFLIRSTICIRNIPNAVSGILWCADAPLLPVYLLPYPSHRPIQPKHGSVLSNIYICTLDRNLFPQPLYYPAILPILSKLARTKQLKHPRQRLIVLEPPTP
jgi:hypothetical protein